MAVMNVTMSWERKKVINLLILFEKYTKSYLEGLDDYDLYNVGVEVDAWKDEPNPFTKTEQKKINDVV